MKNLKIIGLIAFIFAFTSCGNTASDNKKLEETSSPSQEASANETDASTSDKSQMITITDKHGEVEVPKNPKKVVALDSRNFEVLEKMGVKLIAGPKDIMAETSSYKNDDSIENIGNHREPNLELLAASGPDLVIIGQRFADYYDDIKELLPNASVIDLDTDVSENTESPGNDLLQGFINSTSILGEIFDKENIANELIEDLEASIDKAKNAYDGRPVMGVIVSGGEIGYAAPKYGRVWGPVFEILELNPALEVKNDSSDHKGDDISVEAIADSKADYLLVLDRDAGVSSEENAKPAKEVIQDSPALKDLELIKNNRIYYAPNDTYTNESIISYTEIFNGLAELFSK